MQLAEVERVLNRYDLSLSRDEWGRYYSAKSVNQAEAKVLAQNAASHDLTICVLSDWNVQPFIFILVDDPLQTGELVERPTESILWRYNPMSDMTTENIIERLEELRDLDPEANAEEINTLETELAAREGLEDEGTESPDELIQGIKAAQEAKSKRKKKGASKRKAVKSVKTTEDDSEEGGDTADNDLPKKKGGRRPSGEPFDVTTKKAVRTRIRAMDAVLESGTAAVTNVLRHGDVTLTIRAEMAQNDTKEMIVDYTVTGEGGGEQVFEGRDAIYPYLYETFDLE